MGLELTAVGADRDRRNFGYLVFRLLIILLAFGLVGLYRAVLELTYLESMSGPVYGLLSTYLVFAIASLAGYAASKRRDDFMRWQVVVDFVYQSALVWATGGVLSIFTPLLFVTLVAATSLISARGSFALATLATVTLTATMISYALGVAPRAPGNIDWLFSNDKPTLVMAYLLASVLGLYVISALGSVLSHGLRRIEGIQSEIVENMAEGLIALDREGRVVNLNKEARRLFGLAELPHGRRVHLEDVFGSAQYAELRAVFEKGERRRFETIVPNLAGEDRHVEVKISAVKDHGGEARFTIGLMSDLTLKREVEAAENRIQKLEDLQVMAMGIAHEIRNPLASVRGCVQEMAKIDSSNERQQRFAKIICKESDRLDRIIEEFLLYARSCPAGRVAIDLREVLEEAVLLVKSRGDFGSRQLEWTFPEDELRILGDRDRLIQLFLNLGINAIEATAAETGRLAVTMTPKVERPMMDRRGAGGEVGGVEVAFTDNGTGMEQDELKRLFTPFFTTKATGNGLGMSIVEKVVREHMGKLDVVSEKGQGTTVRIWLPLVGCSATEEMVAADTASTCL